MERREKTFKTMLTHTKKTTKAIESWVSLNGFNFPFPNFFVGHIQIPEEPKNKLKKAAKDERLRQLHVILLKEMLTAIMYVKISLLTSRIIHLFYLFILFILSGPYLRQNLLI